MNKWSPEECLVALYAYCIIPFGKLNDKNPILVDLGTTIGRSSSAITMKACNFANLDPELSKRGRLGLSHGAIQDKLTWDEYSNNWEQLAYDALQTIANFKNIPLAQYVGFKEETIVKEEKEKALKEHISKQFFSQIVMASYNNRCSLSGIAEQCLLEVCQIENIGHINPSNGLCLNVLFSKAYSNNLMAITPDLEIKISEKVWAIGELKEETCKYISSFNGKKILSPERFFPNKEYLEKHYQRFLASS